jgi:4-amino-4-deoxychorismate lyase
MTVAQPISLVNGHATDTISVANRGMAYGDGVFETVLLSRGKALWLSEHLQRLELGCQRLGISCDRPLIAAECLQLVDQWAGHGDRGVLKIIISRASSGRGYTPIAKTAERMISVLPAPVESRLYWDDGVALALCQTPLAKQSLLAGLKHLNRLEQVLAASEINRRGFVEGLMLDSSANVIEGSRSNVFIVKKQCLYTPLLSDCGVEGIMRQQIITACDKLNIPLKISNLRIKDILDCEEIFVCNSIFGLWPATKIECIHKSVGPICRLLQKHFESYFYA